MGFFGSKDWNVIAIIFERHDMYRAQGTRGKGSEATTIRDNVKSHPRTIFWGVFDQKGAFLEGGSAAGARSIPATTLQRLVREVPKLPTVLEVLKSLESGADKSVSKILVWNGYPTKSEAG